MIFLTAVESVLSVVLLIALGFVLRQRGWFADTFAANISRLIINIALPASIFVSVLTYLHRDQLAALSDAALCGGRAAGGLAAGMAAPLNPFPSISS